MDIQQLTDHVIDREERPPTPFGVYCVWGDEPEAEVARSVERSVFLEVFGNSPELLEQEYAAYEPASLFACLMDLRRRVCAGIIRIITPSPLGSKTLEDTDHVWGCRVAGFPEIADMDGGVSTWDIATLAVRPEYRRRASSTLVSGALYQGVLMLSKRAEVSWMIAALDLVVLDQIQQQTDRIFTPFPRVEPMSYLDSPATLPVYAHLPSYIDRLKRTDPERYAWAFEGAGFEAAVSQPGPGQTLVRLDLRAELDLRDGADHSANTTAATREPTGTS